MQFRFEWILAGNNVSNMTDGLANAVPGSIAVFFMTTCLKLITPGVDTQAWGQASGNQYIHIHIHLYIQHLGNSFSIIGIHVVGPLPP